MSHKTFCTVSGAIFILIAVLHLLRMVLGWEAVIAGWSVPTWLSGVALVIAGYLGYVGVTIGRKR